MTDIPAIPAIGADALAALAPLATRVLQAAEAAGVMAATAESCTGGLIAAALTEIPGASAVVERGFVTYSNEAKTELLGVDPALIAAHGAVSEPVARAMVDGALARSRAQIAVSVTGVAGPGGSAAKPEGLVHIAAGRAGGDIHHRQCAFGPIGRSQVRLQSARVALEMMETLLGPANRA